MHTGLQRAARVIVVMTESLLPAVWPTYKAEPAELAEHSSV